MNEERRVISSILRHREELLKFFAGDPESQAERERWVVREFLRHLEISFAEDELISPSQADEVDVIFRDARFQVKEIYDPRERRGAELKADVERARNATRTEDLFPKLEARDIWYVDIFPEIVEVSAMTKYAPTRERTDLLFYPTRTDATIDLPEQIPTELLRWRSVSCLFGLRPMILAISENAPSFLRQAKFGG